MSADILPFACVIGWPVSHSRSPLIHGYWLRSLGIAGRYEKAAVAPGEFAHFAAGIGQGGLVGANVTVPHKEAAFAACDGFTAAAAELGAVNTLWREGGRLIGDNTDVTGFIANLDEEAPAWRAQTRRAIVLGAGGAARAVIQGLIASGVERIAIVNRTPERAERLAALFGAKTYAAPWAALGRLTGEADLIVNATSGGMEGQNAVAIDLEAAPAHAIVADIVYIPLQTPLLTAARRRGLATVDGLGMLLHQAAPGFERWFGVRPAVTPELRALIEDDILASAESAR
jgi:shikimate dehydrogenase